ncbi:MAG: TIGR04282 family arsenosugar biosynthesis glycosyltransferase [Beggiatoa sp.]|nr:TIGR04282 family arsenosugar biosynthesis glycosyltransferase [Beggiatoa sp.]
MDSTLIVFAKAPVPGQVKTRLIPYLGAERACALHVHLVRRAIETAKFSRIKHIELWCAPDAEHPFFMACRDCYGVSLHRQQGIDLGSRMAGALSMVLERAGSVLLIGSDSPALTPEDLDAAARAFNEGYDTVLGPAADGGYVLIGLKRIAPGLFTGIPWGTAEVADMTRNRMKALALRCWELPVRPDVDRPADLEGLGWRR